MDFRERACLMDVGGMASDPLPRLSVHLQSPGQLHERLQVHHVTGTFSTTRLLIVDVAFIIADKSRSLASLDLDAITRLKRPLACFKPILVALTSRAPTLSVPEFMDLVPLLHVMALLFLLLSSSALSRGPRLLLL